MPAPLETTLLRPRPAPVPEPAASPPAPANARPAHEPSAFAQLVRGLGHEVARGESLVRGAVSASNLGALDASELLALQTGVYRYSEVVDLTARLIDHATGGLRTILQGQ
jgi:hypothetical protein